MSYGLFDLFGCGDCGFDDDYFGGDGCDLGLLYPLLFLAGLGDGGCNDGYGCGCRRRRRRRYYRRGRF